MSEVRALLLTDVVDSAQLSERLGEAELAALWSAHDRLARDLLPARRGREIDKTDGMLLLFEAAADAVAYAIAYQRGQRTLTAREVEFRPLPKLGAREVAQVRAHLRVSQVAFARLLNVSPRTVQAWESNARTPSDAALKLLHVARRHPEVLLEV